MLNWVWNVFSLSFASYSCIVLVHCPVGWDMLSAEIDTAPAQNQKGDWRSLAIHRLFVKRIPFTPLLTHCYNYCHRWTTRKLGDLSKMSKEEWSQDSRLCVTWLESIYLRWGALSTQSIFLLTRWLAFYSLRRLSGHSVSVVNCIPSKMSVALSGE